MKITSQHIKRAALYIVSFAIIGFISYLLVYKASIIPYGYKPLLFLKQIGKWINIGFYTQLFHLVHFF